MLDFLSPRELAIGIWLLVFFGFASVVAGRALLGVLQAVREATTGEGTLRKGELR